MITPIKIVVVINGGALVSVYTTPGVIADVELCDMDDLVAEGLSYAERDAAFELAVDGLDPVY